MWEAAWKRELKEIFPSLWDNPRMPTDINGPTISIDHLCGQEEWEDGAKQAQAIPLEVLRESTKAAEKTFLALQPEASACSYTKIIQSPAKSFLMFVERLHSVTELQVHSEDAWQNIHKEVPLANANEKCKAAIQSLPFDPPPTLYHVRSLRSKRHQRPGES